MLAFVSFFLWLNAFIYFNHDDLLEFLVTAVLVNAAFAIIILAIALVVFFFGLLISPGDPPPRK